MNVICTLVTTLAMMSLSCDLPASVMLLHCYSQIFLLEIVKCPSYAHFRVSLGHPGIFCLLFYEYCEFILLLWLFFLFSSLNLKG